MGSIRVRKETGKLYFDFSYKGVRCREQTALEDSIKNRKQLEAIMQRIEAKITLEQFNYAEFFPNSNNLRKIEEKLSKQLPKALSMHERIEKANSMTFEGFVEQWFSEKSVEWRASHLKNVRCLIDREFIPAFGSRILQTITKEDLLNFRVKQATLPGRNGNTNITAKSLNNRMGILRMILEEASDRYRFENPYRNIKPLKLQKIHIEPFSLDEVNKILNGVREDYRNYYTVRFFTGMRTGEIDGLKWKYVDFERRQILVRETLIGGKTEYTKNNGSQREIPMLGPVYDALLAQSAGTYRLSPYVFCNSVGEPLDTNNVTKRIWYPTLENLRLAKRRPYQTRHTAATLLLAAGENPEWIARLLGHSSTEMLFKVYSRYIPNLTRMDGSAFENLVGR